MITGYRKTLGPESVWALSRANSTAHNYPRFEAEWRRAWDLWKRRGGERALRNAGAAFTESAAASASVENPRVQKTATTANTKETRAHQEEKEKKRQEAAELRQYPSLLMVILHVFWRPMLHAQILKRAHDIIQFLNPIWLKYPIYMIISNN